jgi:hypothetical protein
MAIQTKSIDAIAKKWSNRAQAASPDYQAGVEGTTKDWASNAANATQAWQAGVTQAAGRGAFTKGVRAAGTEKWRANASSKGGQRYGPGVSVAEPAFTSGFQPYLGTIQSLTLPTRQAKGSPGNYARSQAVGTALHAKKVGG